MAYVAMGHQATGYIVPASDWNQVLDNIAYLKTSVSANIFLSAGGWPSATLPAVSGSIEMATNQVNFKYLSFADGAYMYAEWGFVLPADYNGGTMTFTPYWMHPATTTNFGVVWTIAARAFADDAAGDQAYNILASVSDTGGTTSDIYIGPASAAFTPEGSPAAGNFIQFRVRRNYANASDTMAVAAYLLGIMLTYTRT